MTMSAGAVEELMARYLDRVRPALARAVAGGASLPGKLGEAMRYSVEAGGKRLRPALCLASCEAVGGDLDSAESPAVALELIHTYSLIHDDLPCMDDDDTRRGKPTNHRVFGEALAVLAGDGLLTSAFSVLADAGPNLSSEARVEMIRILAGAAGASGMVGGQALDLEAEGSEGVDLPTLQYIHTHKTGALFAACCRMGGVAGGGTREQIGRLGKFGAKIGLAFQIVDDLLDVTGVAEKLGKATGKDLGRGKATYPGILGVEESRRRVEELAGDAQQIAGAFGDAGEGLALLARLVTDRSS